MLHSSAVASQLSRPLKDSIFGNSESENSVKVESARQPLTPVCVCEIVCCLPISITSQTSQQC